MGVCCGCTKDDAELSSSYQQAWQLYNQVLIDNSYKGPPNKHKIFYHLYLSVIIPIHIRVSQQIELFIQHIEKSKDSKSDLKQYLMDKKQIVDTSLKKLNIQQHNLYRQIIRIRSRIGEPSEISKQREKIHVNEEINNQNKGKQKRIKRPSGSIRSESVRFQDNQLEYSIPITILSSGNQYQENHAFHKIQQNFQKLDQDKLVQWLQFQKQKRELSQKRVQQLQKRNIQLTETYGKLEQLKKKLIEQCNTKTNFYSEQQKICKKQMQIKQKLKVQIQQLNNQIISLNVLVQGYKKQIDQIDKQKSQISIQNKILQKKIKSSILSDSDFSSLSKANQFSFYKNLQIQIEPIQAKKQSFKSQRIPTLRSFILVQQQQEYLQKEEKKIENNQKNYKILFKLFSSSKILPNYLQFQSAVGTRTLIAEMFSQKIIRTQILYTFDEITPTHYNKYIMNKDNILILIKLPNQIILGAFAGKLVQNNEHSQSFIFSISPKREPITLTPSKRIKKIDMDGSYLVFGMGELKIKAKTLDLGCNIGSFQSIYTEKYRSIRIQKFLGSSQRSLQMESYQIHQIQFQQQL